MKKIRENKKTIIALIIFIIVITISVSYAYFSLKIEGNDDAEGVKVTTGIMSLKLDGTTIASLENAYPGTRHTIEFSVENTGTVKTEYNLDIIEVLNEFVKDEDLLYSITRDGEEVQEEIPAPREETTTLLKKVSIEPGVKQEYELTIHFVETKEDQTEEQGKRFRGKIQISNVEPPKLLKNEILVNNTLIDQTPDFKMGEPPASGENTGSGLYQTSENDDYGGPSYYFRGDKSKLKNNVEFANQKWKIVRINGDGSIRLVLVSDFTSDSEPLSIGEQMFNDYTSDDITSQHNMVGFTYKNKTHTCTQDSPCEVTYDSVTKSFSNADFGGINSTIKNELETWYSGHLDIYDNQIEAGYFCNDTSSPRYEYKPDDALSTTYYGAYERIAKTSSESYGKPTLSCPDPIDKNNKTRDYGGLYKTKIGLLTTDEMIMAGLSHKSPYATASNYLYYNSSWWSMSPYLSDSYAYAYVGNRGRINNDDAITEYSVVPVINISANTKVANGDGSMDEPFTIE